MDESGIGVTPPGCSHAMVSILPPPPQNLTSAHQHQSEVEEDDNEEEEDNKEEGDNKEGDKEEDDKEDDKEGSDNKELNED